MYIKWLAGGAGWVFAVHADEASCLVRPSSRRCAKSKSKTVSTDKRRGCSHPDAMEMFHAHENIFEPLEALPECKALAVYLEAFG